jgi:hypothetical protein
MPSTLKISKKTSTNSFKQDQELALKPTMLLVLGMHRSGTSVTARLLECLGAVNSDGLMPATAENPQGFFEDNDVYQFNEFKFLPRLGRAWHSTAEVDWSNLSDTDRSKYALQALEIVKKNYSLSNSLSVLKEPRLGILVPFWLAVLQHAGFNTKIVCAVRDPVSVIRSLNKAYGLSLPHAGMLYVNYWLSILKYCGDLEVSFVQYDEIFVNPAKSLRDVASKLSLPLPQDFEERVHHFSSSFFDKNLRHNTLETKDLGLETDLPPLALELYKTLLAAAQAQNIKKTVKFLEMAKETTQSLQPTFLEFDRQFSQVHSAKSRIHELQTALDAERAAGNSVHLSAAIFERDGRIAGLEGAVSERDGRIAGFEGAVSERDYRVLQLEQDATARAAEIERLNGELKNAQANIQERFEELAKLTRIYIDAQENGEKLASRILQLEQLGVERALELPQKLERDRELAKIGQMVVERNNAIEKLNNSEEELRKSIASIKKEFSLERGKLSEKITRLSQDLSEETKKSAALTSLVRLALGPAFKEPSQDGDALAHLGKCLISRIAWLERKADELKLLKRSPEWKLSAPLRALAAPFGIQKAKRRKLKMLCKIIEESGYFDHAYYLKNNPDVADSGCDPVEHFLLHGGKEERNPSNKFSVKGYLARYPDVAINIDRLNPLLHFLQFGLKEGRKSD